MVHLLYLFQAFGTKATPFSTTEKHVTDWLIDFFFPMKCVSVG